MSDNAKSATVKNFISAASAYCKLIEEPESQVSKFIPRLLASLGTLYVSALYLPETTVHESASDPTARSKANSKNLLPALQAVLSEYDLYCLVFDPYKDKEPVVGSLSDDLLDTYFDIKEGLILLAGDSTLALDAAIWEWRFAFHAHWGDHATNAIRALHALAFAPYWKADLNLETLD